jgi:hypothetical protein
VADIYMVRLLALKGALKLECLGMQRSRKPSAYAIVKREFGFKGNKQSVYTQLCEEIENASR